MTQQERERLYWLQLARAKKIKQKKAAEKLGVSTRWVRRLLKRLKREGDRAVVHGLRGRVSNHQIPEKKKRQILTMVEREYADFGPTLACEYLAEKHHLEVSKETLRKWMLAAGLRKAQRATVERVHGWRERRDCWGELVQWDTSDHDWLEGRGERLYLIAMIDDATSRLLARFVRHDSTEENMKLLWSYLEKSGRPLTFYTDKASLFHTTEKRKRDEPGMDKDPAEMPPTQIGRALRELGITWMPAHSAQAKGRVERNFETAQDRLVKGMRVAGVTTIEQANAYLTNDYLAWWERELTVEPANPDDAHRKLEKSHNLAASLSYVETRQVRPDYTLRWDGKLYQIERQSIVAGLRRAQVRVEKRLDGSLAVRYGDRYLPVRECAAAEKPKAAPAARPAGRRRGGRYHDWNEKFDLKKAPPLWQVQDSSGCRPGESS